MKKNILKGITVFLSLCIMIGASSLSVLAYSDDITGTVDYNGESRLNNYGFIWQNLSKVVNNREGATIHNNQPQAEITYNYGTVGSSTTSSRLYGSAGNEGTIDYNYGVLVSNLEGGSLYRNYGRITGYNYGTMIDNKEGAYLFCNSGIMRENYGTTEFNSKGGTIYGNSGLISDTNTGTIVVNTGTIQRNGVDYIFIFDQTGKVEKNYGTIIKNDIYSLVEMNEGGITENSGYVRNHTGGIVTDNTADGRVYNYGGTVLNNSGKHYIQVDLSAEHATVSYGEGFSSDNEIDCWLLEGESGTATITPDEDYEIKSISTGAGVTNAVKNDDGSWSVTVGGLSANTNADDLGITAAPLPDFYTVTVDLGDRGEDITVEVPRGDRFFDALDKAGVFGTLDAMETEEYIFRDLATKPLDEFANEEEYGDDAYALLNTNVTSDMTVYAGFYTKLKQVALKLDRPVAGTEVTIENDIQAPAPVLTVEDGAHYSIHTDPEYQYSQWYIKNNDDRIPFEGSFEKGKTYYVDCMLNPEFGYWMDDDTTVTVNGATVEEAFGRMSLSVLMSTQAVGAAVLGDADGSGEVDMIDATVVQRLYTNMSVPYPEEILMNGDVDGDGEPTVVDATFIQRFCSLLYTPYPIGQEINR